MWSRLAPIPLLAALAFGACTPEATIIFVNAGGAGGSSGGSEENGGSSGSSSSGGSASGEAGASANGGSGDGDFCDDDCRDDEVCCDEGGCSGRCVGDCREGAPCPDGATCGAKGFCVGMPNGSGGAGGSSGGSGGAPTCEAVTSPDTLCDDCIRDDCATALAACAGNDCACGQWGAETGQANCMIRCVPFRPDPQSLDECAESCGLTDFGSAHPATRALVDCMAEGAAPGNPPVCASCFDPPA